MVVDKIGNTGGVVPVGSVKSGKTMVGRKITKTDSVSISTEAQKAQEIERIRKTVGEMPDVRQKKIDAIKQKLLDGFYEGKDTEILEKVAEKIAQALLR